MLFTKNKFLSLSIPAVLAASFFFSSLLPVQASSMAEQAEARKSLAIQSNENENWPAGPSIGAGSAILIEANTGTILYAKNIHDKQYPASTTKILTALIAVEKAQMDEMVEFSHDAVFGIEPGSANMGADVGEIIPMEQALYGVLVGSANEAAAAVGEHIAGSLDGFADMMNAKAKEIGCENSNFLNAHGLFDENHYTTAYDLSLIACEFFKNELLCKMSSTVSYQVPKTATQPDDDCIIHSKNQLLPNRKYSYEYLLGSKTGYTDETRQTLVSGARKDGMTLVCVIMKEESPYQFTDTVELFEYGFNNFQAVNVSKQNSEYSIDNIDFFNADKDVFGDSKPILTLNQDSYIILPNTANFADTVSTLSYDTNTENSIAEISYTYNDVPIGNITVDLTIDDPAAFEFDEEAVPEEEKQPNTIFVNVKKVLFWIVAIAALLIGAIFIKSLINSYHFSQKRKAIMNRRKKNRVSSEFDNIKF